MTLVPRLPARAWQVLAASALSAAGTGLVMPFTIVYLHEIRGISLATAGIALGTLPVAALAASFGSGPLIDRYGPRRVLVGMLLVAALGSGTLILVREPWHAFVAAGLLGVGISSSWVGLQPTLASIVSPAQRADAFAVQFALLNAGFGVGGLAGGLIVDLDSPGTFELVYLLDALSFLTFAAVMALFLRDVGGRVATSATGVPASYLSVARDRVFVRVWTLNTLLVAIGQVQLDTAFPAYVVIFADQSPRTVGIAFAANTFTIVLCQFFVARWLRGRRRTRGLVVQAALWAAAWTLTLLAGELLGEAAAAAFVAAAMLFAFGEMLHSPTVPAVVNDLAPDELRGRYNAANAVSWQAGRIVGVPIAGVFLGAGLAVPLLLGFVAACGVAALLAMELERRLPSQANGVREVPSAAAAA